MQPSPITKKASIGAWKGSLSLKTVLDIINSQQSVFRRNFGQQNSSELGLVKAKGSQIPGTDTRPKFPYVSPPPELNAAASLITWLEFVAVFQIFPSLHPYFAFKGHQHGSFYVIKRKH